MHAHFCHSLHGHFRFQRIVSCLMWTCVDALQFLCSMQRIFACENLLLQLKTLKVNEFISLGKQGRRNQVYYQQYLLCANWLKSSSYAICQPIGNEIRAIGQAVGNFAQFWCGYSEVNVHETTYGFCQPNVWQCHFQTVPFNCVMKTNICIFFVEVFVIRWKKNSSRTQRKFNQKPQSPSFWFFFWFKSLLSWLCLGTELSMLRWDAHFLLVCSNPCASPTLQLWKYV